MYSTVRGARVRRSFLLDCARRAALRIRRHIVFVHVILISDREMTRLHRTYMSLSGTTDVMAFDLADSLRKPVEGEIYISVNQARRQAREYGVPLYLEAGRLAVHGVLHLAGFEDGTPAARERMHGMEDRILNEARHNA